MNERIKYLRVDNLHISQDALGKRLGITGAAISRIEKGERAVTEQMILAICREFNVNEEWLRNGTGEMFYTMSQDEELAYIVGQTLPNASKEMKDTFIAFGKLSKQFTPEEWVVIRKFIKALGDDDK